LQSNFSKDYTLSAPAYIDWAALGDRILNLHLRPYAV
jgi:hypothetical protein